jgi:hypothetical protein
VRGDPDGKEEFLEERVHELGHDHADDLFDEEDPEFDDGDVVVDDAGLDDGEGV